MKYLKLFVILFLAIFNFTAHAKQVVVNEIELSQTQIEHIEMALGYDIQSGRYWYDPISGLWGLEKQAAKGKAPAGLLKYNLLSSAFNSTTKVYFNNRALLPCELEYCQKLAGRQINPGHYWLNAKGQGGKINSVTEFFINYAQSERVFCQNIQQDFGIVLNLNLIYERFAQKQIG
ncbi:hypothetical protein [Catenovulum sediminis]|uniref:Uncharacterized protein n=1 Tax=Catenovulum sediminis TaxID=1740262 RepID=A0ABV1RL80_9ALTE|nr:hypothetical protein [Catenovulum sediminis]